MESICRIGALAKYRCERGYKIVGEPLVTCEETGFWSGGVVPECVCKYSDDAKLIRKDMFTHKHRS